MPGASCAPPERVLWCVCFAPLPCANNATAMPNRQNTEAIRMRRLKKADFDVDFFFIGGSGVGFTISAKPKTVIGMLGETPKGCQHFFWKFRSNDIGVTQLSTEVPDAAFVSLPTPRQLGLLIACAPCVFPLLVLDELSALQIISLTSCTHFGDSRMIASPRRKQPLMSGLRAEAAV